jgi:hypothetical protein
MRGLVRDVGHRKSSFSRNPKLSAAFDCWKRLSFKKCCVLCEGNEHGHGDMRRLNSAADTIESNSHSASQEIPITVFTTARHWSLSWVRWIQSIPSHPISLRCTPLLYMKNYFSGSSERQTLYFVSNCVVFCLLPHCQVYEITLWWIILLSSEEIFIQMCLLYIFKLGDPLK